MMREPKVIVISNPDSIVLSLEAMEWLRTHIENRDLNDENNR